MPSIEMTFQSKTKKSERVRYKELRSSALLEIESLIFFQVKKSLLRLKESKELKGFIGIYWPLNGEVDIRGLKSLSGLKFALPATQPGEKITYHPWLESTKLKKDFCGIPSPLNERPLSPKELNLLLVPALAMDYEGTRLGYGGGFYDRLRSDPRWFSITALCILPKICISSRALPKDNWDIPFNGWINEEGKFKVKKN